MEKTITYGLGHIFFYNLERWPEIPALLSRTVSFCDKHPKFEHLFGKPVITPDKIENYNYDYIVITSEIYFNEICTELTNEYGISADKIVYFEDYYQEERRQYHLIQGYVYNHHRDIYERDNAGLSNECLANCRILNGRESALELYPKGGGSCRSGCL
jgi:hypothetical protein